MKTTLKLKIMTISLLTQFIAAQKTSSEIQIKDLEMPSAPALTLLDQSATNIETPKNIQALTTSIMNSFENNNFGFEINPYMLFKERKNFYDYYNVKRVNNKYEHDGFLSSIYKSLSISVAKVKKDSTNSFSIGARTNLIRLVADEDNFNKKFSELDDLFSRITNNLSELDVRSNRDDFKDLKNLNFRQDTIAFNKIINDLKESDLSGENFDTNKIDKLSKLINIFLGRYNSSLKITEVQVKAILDRGEKDETFLQIIQRYRGYKKLADLNDKQIAEYYKKEDAFKKEFPIQLAIIQGQITKPLFTVDVAAAYSHFYLGNTYSDGHMGKFGAWTTVNINAKIQDDNKFYISAYGYGRYLKDNAYIDKTTNKYTSTDYFDIGCKGELEFHKISVAYEYIHRTKEVNNYRSVGSIKYKYNDTITLNGGFGKNFEQTNNLVSFLGISWGIESGNKFDAEKP